MQDYQWIAQFGFAAVMAFAMVLLYRHDRTESEKRLAELVRQNHEYYAASIEKLAKLTENFRAIVQENTAAIAGLREMLDRR